MERDNKIFDLIQQERNRQTKGIELIASENFVSDQVMEAMGSVMTNKYAEGYPGKRYYGGCQVVDQSETIAIERAKQLYGACWANVQPHSGAQANMAVFMACLNAGDTFMGMNLNHGGHLSHGSAVNFSGIMFNVVDYSVEEETGTINYDKMEARALETHPKLIIGGASAYSRDWDWARMRQIADKIGAILMGDISHPSGMIAKGYLNNAVKYCHIVTTTTHKTLRGPRGGLILCNNPYLAKKINSAVFPGTQGGPLMHVIAGKAVCFGEALKDDFKEYQKRVIENAQALANGLTKRGLKLVSGGTDNHLCLLDLRDTGVTGKELENRLDEVNITLNKNTVPNEPLSPFVTSGVRIGAPAATTRGLNTDDFDKIAEFIYLAVTDFDAKKDYILSGVKEICDKYPLYE